jgi:hypothetical protein
MTSDNDLFGELRSIVQAKTASWDRLVETINQWSDEERFEAEALPYLDDAMAHEAWSAQDRVAPASWAAGAHPALALANGLDLTRCALTADTLALITSPRKHPLVGLWLDDTAPDAALLRAIGRCEHLAQLHTLSLRGCEGIDEAKIEALAGATALTGLRALDLASLKIDVDALYPLTHSPLAEQLEELRIEGNSASSRDAVYYVFFDLMEKLGRSMSRRPGKKADAAQRAEREEQQRRAKQLYGMLEEQLVEWASDLNLDEDYPLEFSSFHDLME